MPTPDPRSLSSADVGSSLRPKSASRDLRASLRTTASIAAYNASIATQPLGSTGNFIRVFPAVAEFKNTEKNVTHVLTITVVNRSERPKRIRFTPPKTKDFTLHQIPSVAVAPGLEISADLEFFSTVEGDFSDEIYVVCETDRIKVPIRALPAAPELQFDGFCLFGPVEPGTQHIRYVDVVNTGQIAAEFEFVKKESMPFIIEPASGRLGPADSDDCFMRVKVLFTAEELGVARGICEVQVNGTVIDEVLDISAMVIRHGLELVSPEGRGRCESLQFGTIYVGEQRKMQALLVNDGPAPVDYTSTVPRMDGIETDDIYFSIVPSTSTLEQFEQKLIEFVYSPPHMLPTKGFKTQHDELSQKEDHEVAATFQCVGMDDLQVAVRLCGRAVHPAVTLSDRELQFVDTKTNSSTEITITLRNHHDELPIAFKSTAVAHFKCRPASGRLLPYQSTQLIISFCPNQLGRHKGRFLIELMGASGTVVGSSSVGVTGFCGQEGTKVMKGGITATYDQFKPEFHFQGATDLAQQRAQVVEPFTRHKAWVAFPPEVNKDTKKYTFGEQKFEALDQNKHHYLDWLKQQYNKRNAVFSLSESKQFGLGNVHMESGHYEQDPDYQMQALDMGMFGMPVRGMPPGAGLKEPSYSLPPSEEPLYLRHKGDGPAAIKPRSRVIDEDRVMMKKFKPQPTTQKEKRDCSTGLGPQQIMSISTNPANMEFGSICIQADVTKSFTVSNDTLHNILVKLDTLGNKDLAHSKPMSQVIPSGATAGFDITLHLEGPVDINTKFGYSINNHHHFTVPVKAQAVPVMLSANKTKIHFTFPPHSVSPTISETVLLVNPGNNMADFKLEAAANFTAIPSEGTVEPLSSEEITITYRPGQQTQHAQPLTVQVIGGANLNIDCSGEVEEGTLASKQRTVDFQALPAGTTARKNITLVNQGEAPAAYFIDPDELKIKCPGLSFSPDKGLIPAGQMAQVSLSVRSERAVKLDASVYVAVRGGKPIKLAIRADIIVPEIQVLTEEIAFGATYLGASTSKQLHLENKGIVPAIFSLDLRKHPEFSAHIPEDLEVDEELRERIVGAPPAGAHSPLRRSMNADPEAGALSVRSKAKPGEVEDLEGSLVRFKVPAGAKGVVDVVFSPVALNSHVFELPLSLLGLPTSASRSLRRVVAAESEKPRLLLSSPTVEYGRRVVVSENMRGFSYTFELTLTNCDDAAFFMDARLKGPHVDSGVFTVDSISRELQKGKAATMVLKFTPRAQTDYKCKLVIFLDAVSNTPYFNIDVTGSGVHPTLGFDRREVMLPCIPLGIKTTVTFFVLNYGYDNLDLQYQLPPDSVHAPISVSFPMGTMIGVVKKKLPVQVTFTSKKAMSFRAQIDILDGKGAKYTIPVIGTADNSFASVFPFLSLQQDVIELDVKPGKPISAHQSGEWHNHMLGPHGVTIVADDRPTPVSRDSRDDMSRIGSRDGRPKLGAGGIQSNAEYLCWCSVLTQPESVTALIKWANINLFRTSIENFPDDLMESKGRQLMEVVESSTGKASGNQKRGNMQQNQREEGYMQLQTYTDMITLLKGYGALLHSVKPEYLLPYDLFAKLFMDPRAANPIPDNLMPFYETHYDLLNMGTWLMLMYQVIKLFVVNRLTPKLLKSLPGVDPKSLGPLNVTGSNVYSPSEGLLLSWLTYHHAQVQPTDKLTVSNFEADLHDCRVFASVLSSHVPALRSTLAGLKRSDESDVKRKNALAVAEAISSLGLEYCPAPDFLCTAPGRDLMLFCVFLFNSMPSFIPKAVVEFDGRLNDGVTKHIELSNPSNKPLIYSVRISGSTQFKAADTLKLNSKERVSFPVTCYHNTRQPAEAQIFFIGERLQGGGAGATLVFGLRSSVKSYKRTEVITKSTKLYDPITIEITVKNSSPDTDTELAISMRELTNFGKDRNEQVNERGKPRKKSLKFSEEVTTHSMLPTKTFWVKKEGLKLKKGASATLHVNFLPLRLMPHSCLVFVNDSLQGEYCIELQVKVDLPSTTEICKFSHAMRSTIVKDVAVSMRNSAIDKCRAAIMELLGQQAGKEWFKAIGDQSRLDYKVEYLTQCFSGPRDLSLSNSATSRTQSPAAKNRDSSGAAAAKPNATQNKLPIELKPLGPGKYESRVVLRSVLDVRVLDVEATITATGTRAELTFSCPARQSIIQEIPIINFSEQPWHVVAQLQGDFFSGPKDMQVPPSVNGVPGKALYQLVFTPRWISSADGELILRNSTIGDAYQYQLKGIGEEPMAEDHIQVDSRARWKTTVPISVRNILGDRVCTYSVESDLIGMTGDSELVVPPHETTPYELQVMMPRGGVFAGSITFLAPNGEYIWYTLEITAENPPSEQTVQLRARARTAVAADITIVNPLDEAISFDVQILGSGLIGAPTVSLEPKGSTVYELIYSPLIQGREDGSLTFVNDDMGEFWYALELIAEPADPVNVPEISAELGKFKGTKLQIENPLGDDVLFRVANSNPSNFRLSFDNPHDPTIMVPAYQQATLDLEYVPSSLGEEEEATLTLSHPQAGKWIFLCSGRGRAPQEMDLTQVSAAVGQSSSNQIHFRNPLKAPLQVQVRLEPTSEHDGTAFELLLNQREDGVLVGPSRDLDIPFLFSPSAMVEHGCSVVVHAPQLALQWVFPVMGTAEAAQSDPLGRLQCKARERLAQIFNLTLHGAVDAPAAADRIDLEILPQPEHKAMLSTALHVAIDDAIPRPPAGVCRIKVAFEPLKAVRTKVQLRVTKASGGRWLFDLELVATQADIDDVIRIEGKLNSTSSVAFRMCNQFDQPAPFKAFFALDSAPEFTVSPTQGTLQPYGSEGTNFVVSYTPKTYGKIYSGRLVIETSEMQWTYQVQGEHPRYEVPKDQGGRVDTHISASADPELYKASLQRHNYMKENVAALKQTQQQQQQLLQAAAAAQESTMQSQVHDSLM